MLGGRGFRSSTICQARQEWDRALQRAARQWRLPWQRCQFYLQQNAQSYISRLNQRKTIGVRIRSIFNAPDKAEAERLLK